MPKPKPKPLGPKNGLKKNWKTLKNHLEGKLDKLDNASDVESCRIGKIELRKWNMEGCKKLHPYPQGIMKHQKGHELLEELNRNEAQ
jgi:hypothetical protein